MNTIKKPQLAKGKLGILIPGLGALATILIAGVEALKKGSAQPIDSLTQLGNIRIGKRTDNYNPRIKDFVPLANLNDIVFGGWDIFSDEAEVNAKVLELHQFAELKLELEKIKPMAAVFDSSYIKNISGPNVKTAKTKYELALALIRDIEKFKAANNCDRLVVVWFATTEKYIEPTGIHNSIDLFEIALKNNDELISPSLIYAYAASKIGIPFVNGAPNLTVDIPALIELSNETNIPIAGKDFKTGQTLMKTIVAPRLHARALGVKGWFSANILGNCDGKLLDDPKNFKTKEVSKLSVLKEILKPHDGRRSDYSLGFRLLSGVS